MNALRPGDHVALRNPTRSTERAALAARGEVWVVAPHPLIASPRVAGGEVLVASLDGADLRWWRARDAVPA